MKQIILKEKINKDFFGERASHWKGGRQTHGKNSYIRLYVPKHPKANKRHCVFEHTIVMEKSIGRYLKKGEEVHHINKKKDDNRIENLQLCNTQGEHRRYDKGWWKVSNNWWKKCTRCKIEMEVNTDNFYKFKTGTSTSEWFPYCKECSKVIGRERRQKVKHEVHV